MTCRNVLVRSVLAGLGLVAVTALAGCARGTPQQARAVPANLAIATTSAATAAPDGGPGSVTEPARRRSLPAPQRVPQPEFARVVAVQPLTRTQASSTPRRVCGDQEVAVPETYRDSHQIGGAIVGGLVGGLLGNQVGGGRGRTLATLAGAAGGAFAGHEIQRDHQEDNPSSMQMRYVCHTVQDRTVRTETAGYDVTYILDGRAGHIHMNHDPGVGIGLPVRDGVVVAQAAGPGGSQAAGYYR